MKTQPRMLQITFRLWYSLLVSFTVIVVLFVIVFWFIWRSSSDSREATCEVIRAQQHVFNETPPETDAGRNAEEAWDRLARSLKCE